MMGRVCVVIEHCDAWDDYECYEEVKAVAGNPTIAENLIEGYKNECISRIYDDGGIATDMTEIGGDVRVISEIRRDRMTYQYQYYWTIEQFDIVES